MSDTPQEVQIALAEFDRNQLPEAQRILQGDAFRQAVQAYFTKEFQGEGGAAEVVVTRDRIIIRWVATEQAATPTDWGIEFLKEGDRERGIAILRKALEKNPDDADALLNLGMALSDMGAVDEAADFLKRLLEEEPDNARGWVALGVAESRRGRDAAGIEALRRAVALDPQDGHAHKNLGSLLSRAGAAEEGLPHLQLAVKLLPSDAQSWFNLALALEKAGDLEGAEGSYRKVIFLDGVGALAKRAQEGCNRIAESNFRVRGQGDGFRPDAFSYCVGALRTFQGMPQEEVQKITFEIALLGSGGLKVHDPTEQYTLRSLPGKFSGLQLLCIEYVGFKIIDPSTDIGFDLSREYAAATKHHEER